MPNDFTLAIVLTPLPSRRDPNSKLLAWEWTGPAGPISLQPFLCAQNDRIVYETDGPQGLNGENPPTLRIDFTPLDGIDYSPYSRNDTRALADGILGTYDAVRQAWVFQSPDSAGDGSFVAVNQGAEYAFTIEVTAQRDRWSSDPQMNVGPPPAVNVRPHDLPRTIEQRYENRRRVTA